MTGAGRTCQGRCRFPSSAVHHDGHPAIAFVSADTAAAIGSERPRALSTAKRCRRRPSGPLRTEVPAVGPFALSRPRACASAIGADASALTDGRTTGAPAPASVALAAAVLPTPPGAATSRGYRAVVAVAAAVRRRQWRWRSLLRALWSGVAGGGSRLRRLAVAGLAALVVLLSSGLLSAVAAEIGRAHV